MQTPTSFLKLIKSKTISITERLKKNRSSNMKNHLLRNGAYFLLILFVITIIIFALYVKYTSVDLPQFSNTRNDWNDMANFVSNLVTPFIAFVAAFLLWKQIDSGNDGKKLEVYILRVKGLEPKFESVFADVINDIDDFYLHDAEMTNSLNQYNIINTQFNEGFNGTLSSGFRAVKDGMDNVIMDGLKKTKHLKYNSEIQFYEENKPHKFGIARNAIKIWYESSKGHRINFDA